MAKKRNENLELKERAREYNSRRNNNIESEISTLSGLKIIAKGNSQKELIRSIKTNEITICGGKSGTGKTFISLLYALSLLGSKSNKFNIIYLIKSVTTLRGEEIGFLKGDLNEKIDPFMMSFRINLEKMIDMDTIRKLFENDIIRPFPLAYARGVSLDNAIIIADEMQNVSIENARTLLTRIGENSKMILLGDTNQIDLSKKGNTSLNMLLNMFENIKNIGCIRMSDNDTNVRNPIIDIIETEFEKIKQHNGK